MKETKKSNEKSDGKSDEKSDGKSDGKKDLIPITKDYDKFKVKYNLPEFLELDRIFDIGHLELKKTDLFLRKVRQVITDKIISYLRFLEILVNPGNNPLFLFKLTKKLNNSDKEGLLELYEKLGKMHLEAVLLDLNYDAEKEAGFIIKTFNIFNKEIKINLSKIIRKLIEEEISEKKDNSSSYFG